MIPESEFSAWRAKMRQAGIGPGPVLDELESHLRDGFEARVREGMAEETAFAAVVEKLGPPTGIKQEFLAAMSATKRFRALLQEPFRIFPTNLKFCAWATLLFGPYTMLAAFTTAANNRLFSSDLFTAPFNPVHVSFVLTTATVFWIGLMGLIGGAGYLWKRNFVSFCWLTFYWTFFFWCLGVMGLFFTVHFGEEGFALEAWPPLVMLPVAITAYCAWRKRLRIDLVSRDS
jgi:hypothetical protein